ncbi:Hypothetical Protein FCC1311_018022 [Hondaea fermentalgiana]|uniref:Uncharacterized protein n=1 Tax=Hondaea fermentalgiana TaxID=2315210 RepID=A0A2R5GAK6_9STRA|nr:Hypothetical Protein FCC1311_018022 [Hondaea fermentalgiana]|eukprot:GBG25583.1 Hypothetical Protein FCC1311_018022 [Hondaea fermentalgiana]
MAMSRRQSLARRAKCEASNLRDAEERSSDESEVLQAVEEISAQGNTEAKRSTSVSKAAKDEDVTSDGEMKSDDDDDDDDDDNEEMEETNLSRKQIKTRRTKRPWRRTRPRYKGDTVGEALVYGDSLTWAFQHDRFERFAMPWCELLRPRLWEKGLALVQSNFPERTTIYNDNPEHDLGWNVGTKAEDFNGIRHFGATFSSHSPKWLMIMLGTHDLKARVRAYARERAELGLHAEEDTNKPASDPGSGSDSSDSESEFSAESDTEVQDQKSPQTAETSGGRTASANAVRNGHVGKGADVTATISEADA